MQLVQALGAAVLGAVVVILLVWAILRTVGLPPGHADQANSEGRSDPLDIVIVSTVALLTVADVMGRKWISPLAIAVLAATAVAGFLAGRSRRRPSSARCCSAGRSGWASGTRSGRPRPGRRGPGGQGPGGHRHTPHPARAARRERVGRPSVRRNDEHPPRRRPRHRPRHLRAGVGATVPAGAAAAQRVHPSACADAPRGDRAPHADGTGARAGADPGPSAGVGMRGRPVRGGIAYVEPKGESLAERGDRLDDDESPRSGGWSALSCAGGSPTGTSAPTSS